MSRHNFQALHFSILMVGRDIANFVAEIVLKLLLAFVATKSRIVAAYFIFSTFYFVTIIKCYVDTFYPDFSCILCREIIFRCRDHVLLPSALSFVAKELSSVATYFQMSFVLAVSRQSFKFS